MTHTPHDGLFAALEARAEESAAFLRDYLQYKNLPSVRISGITASLEFRPDVRNAPKEPERPPCRTGTTPLETARLKLDAAYNGAVFLEDLKKYYEDDGMGPLEILAELEERTGIPFPYSQNTLYTFLKLAETRMRTRGEASKARSLLAQRLRKDSPGNILDLVDKAYP